MKHILQPIGLFIAGSLTTLSSAQTKDIREMFTPASRAIYEQAGRKDVSATRLFNQGKVKEALATVGESIAELKTINMSGDYYLLAQCHVALGHRTEANAAFQKCFSWNRVQGDLNGNVADVIGSATDYAIFLSKSSRIDDAKQMYYYALRNVNAYDDLNQEPYPFVVVFDPSPNAEVWRFYPRRFEAACIMLRVLSGQAGDDYAKWMDQISMLAPDWLYPNLYRATRLDEHWDAYAAKARALAKTPNEKVLVERVLAYPPYHTPKTAPSPVAARRRIPILTTSKAELAKTYQRLVDPNPLPM